MSKAIVLFSGGMDSTMALLAAHRSREVICVAVNYGQRHNSELRAAWDITKALGVPYQLLEFQDFSAIAPSKLTGRNIETIVVPNRNAFLLSVAGAVAIANGYDAIVVGCNADDEAGFPDCRGTFLAPMEFALSAAAERHIRIESPWLKLSKGEALASIEWTPEELNLIRTSVSCYEGSVPGCGACPACEKRSIAFRVAGVE